MSRLAILFLILAVLAPIGCNKAAGTASSTPSGAAATPAKPTVPEPDIRTQP